MKHVYNYKCFRTGTGGSRDSQCRTESSSTCQLRCPPFLKLMRPRVSSCCDPVPQVVATVDRSTCRTAAGQGSAPDSANSPKRFLFFFFPLETCLCRYREVFSFLFRHSPVPTSRPIPPQGDGPAVDRTSLFPSKNMLSANKSCSCTVVLFCAGTVITCLGTVVTCLGTVMTFFGTIQSFIGTVNTRIAPVKTGT